jgi:hypothetical protein
MSDQVAKQNVNHISFQLERERELHSVIYV